MKYIIVLGEPTNGFTYVGPFRNYEQAYNYAEGRGISNGSWITCLHEPTKEGEDG